MSRVSSDHSPHSPIRLRPTHSHIPALDGLRGLAVLLVLFCHATMLKDLPGPAGKLYLALARISWCGVDLFFVLSGFLITGILFDAKGKPNFFRNFYARRTVRIFPLYYAFVLIALFVLPRFAPSIDHHFVERPAASWPYWLYASNFYQTFHPTHHIIFVSWSLAIEEQFYLVWPLVVFFASRKNLLRITVGMMIGSALLRIALMLPAAPWIESMGLDPWRMANNWTPFRLDGLAVGAWLALAIRGQRFSIESLAKRSKFLFPISAIVLAAAVGSAYFSGWRGGIGQSPAYVLIGYPALAAMFGSLLCIAIASRQQSLVSRSLLSPPLLVLGKYSYAAYLLHIPVNVLIHDLWFDPADATSLPAALAMQAAFYAVSLAGTLALSWFSWHAMEKHFLKLKDYFQSAPPAPPTPTTPDHEPIRLHPPQPLRLSA